jgi:hypothetical protein
MRIDKEDSEEIRRVKREWNVKEMALGYRWGSMLLPLGIPKDCHVEQPRDHLRAEWDYIQGDEQYTNALTRVRYYDGKNVGHYRRVFSGNCHAAFMAGVKRDGSSLNNGNFDSIVQSMRASKKRGVTHRGNKKIKTENQGKNSPYSVGEEPMR